MKNLPKARVSQAEPRLFLFLLAALFLAACASTPSSDGVNELPAPSSLSALRPGDSLVIALQGVPDPSSQTVQIDDRGYVTLPYVGQIKAAGIPVAEFSDMVRTVYVERKIYRTVDVAVTATERYVFVGGEVNRPGRILWTPDLTVTKAVQAAGGFTVYARENRLSVIRDQVAYPFDADQAVRNPANDARLAPGDAVQVPKSAF